MRNYTFISIGSWALTKNNKIETKTNQKLFWANWAKSYDYEEDEEEEEETERSQEEKSPEEDGQTNEPKPAAGLIYKANKPKVKYSMLEIERKGLTLLDKEPVNRGFCPRWGHCSSVPELLVLFYLLRLWGVVSLGSARNCNLSSWLRVWGKYISLCLFLFFFYFLLLVDLISLL